MDLSNLEPTVGATIALRHPVTNEPLSDDSGPLTIDIVGVDSPPFQARQLQLANRRLATAGNRKSKITAEDLEKEGIDTVAGCITGWSSNIELDGNRLDYSRANAKELLKRLIWVREQVDAAITDRGNFLKASPTS